MLIEAGAPMESTDAQGRTPLDLARLYLRALEAASDPWISPAHLRWCVKLLEDRGGAR
jgi:hypothetical protein